MTTLADLIGALPSFSVRQAVTNSQPHEARAPDPLRIGRFYFCGGRAATLDSTR